MNMHKLLKDTSNWPSEDVYLFKDLMELVQEAKIDFERVGVEFTYHAFKAYAHRILDPRLATSGNYAEHAKKQLKIIDGDNLDAIEEAAENKGLI